MKKIKCAIEDLQTLYNKVKEKYDVYRIGMSREGYGFIKYWGGRDVGNNTNTINAT